MFKVILAVFSLFVLATNALALDLQIITEIAPPLNYTDNGTEEGKVIGTSTEIVQEIQKRIGDTTRIEVMPWARGYNIVQSKPNVMLYSTTRTEAREVLFKWVGPIAKNEWVFFAKKGSGIKIASLDDAKKVGSIGAYRDDVREQFLKEKGFTNLDTASDPLTLVKKLMAGRNDLLVSDILEGALTAKDAGFDPSELEPVFTIKKADLYCAFSKGTPDEVVAQWQKALDAMKADGTLKKITGM